MWAGLPLPQGSLPPRSRPPVSSHGPLLPAGLRPDSPLLIRTPVIGLQPSPVQRVPILTNHTCKDPIS